MLTNHEIAELENQVGSPKEFFIKEDLLTVDELECILNKKPNGKIHYSRWIVKNPNGKGNIMVLVISKLFSTLNSKGIPNTISKLIGVGQVLERCYDFGNIKILNE